MEKAEEIFEAANEAGYQLIKEGEISEDLLLAIRQPLVSERQWWHS